jgi:polysaccharide deacetylase 2 family uncharacterized protein YibQ
VPRTKRRRRTGSPLLPTLALFGLGLGCCIAAGVIWLWSPDAATVTAQHHVPDSAVTPLPVTPPAAATAAPAPAATETETGDEVASPAPLAVEPESPEPTEPAAATPRAESPWKPAAGDGHPRLAIIIDDCGQWPVTERAFVALDFPVTLSVLPHVRYGAAIAREADAAGKGVMLHLPMQTISGRYPGPGTITVKMDDEAIRAEVAGDLAALPEARGVNNHEGSLATANRRVMNDVADVLVRENRYWIDSKTSAASIAASVTRERGVPTASRDVFLDNVDDEAAVEAQLREAADRAREDGSAIAIGHPREATLLAVRTLGPELIAHGIDLTFASDLVH